MPNPRIWSMLAVLYEQIVNLSEDGLDTLDLDEMDLDTLHAIALKQFGEPLPGPALKAALVVAQQARLSEIEVED